MAANPSLTQPVTELDARYGEPGVTPIDWSQATSELDGAELFWISTVRDDGRPHVTPLLAVWQDGAMHFCTGAQEQKAQNLAQNAHCILTTGTNARHGGTDLVIEGDAVRVRDEDRLGRLAARWEEKYGAEWHFDVQDGAFVADGHAALVFEVAPTTAYAFGKDPYSQTRYRF
jgi:pyridoxine/pyridoxamine 5'-phosphate oxidase